MREEGEDEGVRGGGKGMSLSDKGGAGQEE